MPAHYDDPQYFYPDYWAGRNYEHQSEVIAISRLLETHHFASACDIGGGHGRLTPILARYAKKVFLIEPSNKLRFQAVQNLASYPQISVLPGTAQATRLPDSSQNLVIMVRVMHHLPDPAPAFKEICRILKPGGLLILEFANSHHFKAKITSLFTGQPILPLPVEKRSPINIKRRTIPFVNHSPQTINKLLVKSGFEIISELSVSNFRSPLLKQLIPDFLLLKLETLLQPLLAGLNFGPSIFILAKVKTP